MGATEFLYGDSTPSPLTTDFIGLLDEAFDFAVQVLLHDGMVVDAAQRVARMSQALDGEVQGAQAMVDDVSRLLARAADCQESLAARCAARIRQGIEEVVRSEAESARASIDSERARLSQTAASARGACARAFERLVVAQELPGTVAATAVRLEGGDRYEAQLLCRTPYGLRWTVGLAIAPSHALAHAARIEALMDRLEIAAPRAVGWIHKQVKLRRQRLDRLYLVELSVGPPSTTVKLRRTPDPAGAGFDLAYSSDPSRVEIARVLQGGAVPDPPYVAGAQDVANLQRLRERLVALATELAANRRSLIAASLDDTPLLQLEPPRLVADRLLSTIGPMVQELASRSLAPGELVIKRLVGGNVREEVFVSKAELRKKLELLPAELRRAFDAFQLADRVERSPEQGLDGAGRAEAGAPPPPVEPAGPHRRPPARAVTPPSPPPRDRRPEPRGAGGTGRWPALPLTVAADEEAAIATPADGRPTVPGARPVSPPGRSQGARLGARRDPGAGAP